MAGERMIKAIQQAAVGVAPKTDIVRGIVTSVMPLKITVENRLELTETFLTLSPLCKPKIVTADDIKTDGSENGISSILIWRGLQAGDNVLMMQLPGGNMYYVLQREGDY